VGGTVLGKGKEVPGFLDGIPTANVWGIHYRFPPRKSKGKSEEGDRSGWDLKFHQRPVVKKGR